MDISAMRHNFQIALAQIGRNVVSKSMPWLFAFCVNIDKIKKQR